MPVRYYTVTWDQLHRDARALAWRLIGPLASEQGQVASGPVASGPVASGPFRGIVAITRGGLIPAAIIARELDIRLVESVSVVTYGHGDAAETEIGTPMVVKPPAAAGDGTGFLIVDDLVDTGTTARIVRGLLPRAHFACIYAKPAGKTLVDSFVTEVSQDTWILFPWDTEPQFSVPLARRDRPA